MGYSSCAVPGCKSKPGQGLIFRKFPDKKPSLARQWLENVPAGFRVSPYTAVCELHFEPTEFERPREDGKKRLKDSAVPRMFLGPVHTSADSGLSTGNICDTSSVFCTSDVPEIPLNDEDTSVANICDMSSIFCTSDLCEVIMNDNDTASDNNIAVEKQVTSSYTATENVSATVNAEAPVSEKK